MKKVIFTFFISILVNSIIFKYIISIDESNQNDIYSKVLAIDISVDSFYFLYKTKNNEKEIILIFDRLEKALQDLPEITEASTKITFLNALAKIYFLKAYCNEKINEMQNSEENYNKAKFFLYYKTLWSEAMYTLLIDMEKKNLERIKNILIEYKDVDETEHNFFNFMKKHL